MTSPSAIFVDDELEKQSTTRIVEILNDGGINCELKPPPRLADVADLICDVFITDFELAKMKLTEVAFSGNTLSTEFRNYHPNIPIVLLTQQGVFSHRSRQVRTDNTDLDLIWYKNDAAENPNVFVREVMSLVSGFASLALEEGNLHNKSQFSTQSNRSIPPEWQALIRLMGATEDEYYQLRETTSPIQRGKWIAPEIAEWIRCVVIQYPGVLLDPIHASVRLGMDPEDFFADLELQEMLKPAKYSGIFHEFGERWWKSRLIEIASELLLREGVNRPILESFVPTFNRVFSKSCRHSRCVWDQSEIADSVCYIEKKPVKSRNSVLYRPDNRPATAYVEKARVSRWAITRNNDFDEFLVDPDSIDLALRWMDEG